MAETIIALKQQNIEQSRQIEQLMVRLNLLMQQQKQSQPPTKRLQQAYEKKKLHDDVKLELIAGRKSIPDRTEDYRRRNLIMKHSISEAIKRSMQELEQMKKLEAKELKVRSKQHEARIEQYKQQDLSKRRQNKIQVQLSEFQSKQRFQQYWDDRTQQYISNQTSEKDYLHSSLSTQQEMLRGLEYQEMQLMNKLQQTRSVKSNFDQQIRDAQILSVKDYEAKYGQPKSNKKTHSNSQ